MRSLNKLNKNHPEKKKTGPAVKKESHKNGVSLADKKKPKNKKVVEKVEPQHKKKEAPIIKGKPPKNPVHTVAVKKQPVKGKPAGKAAQPSKKKEAPIVKKKTFETKVISFEMDQQSEEKDVIVVEKIQTQNVMVSSVDLGIRYKCYKCGIKFYDLGKPQPLCPSCGANQLDGLIKAARKRKGKHRSAFVAKTEPHNIAPGENEELHEVVDELDSEFVLDVDDIVLEEHEDSDDKEKLREEYFMAKTTVAKKAVKKKPLKAAAAKAVKPKVVAKATKSKTAKKAVKPKTAVKAVKKKAK